MMISMPFVFRMDVGALAGGDGGPRRADSAEGGLEIMPLEMYDSARAKIEANLRWLFAKAYGEGECISFLQSLLTKSDGIMKFIGSPKTKKYHS